MDNLIKIGGGVTPIYIPSLVMQHDHSLTPTKTVMTFQLNGKYKKLTIAKQAISQQYYYDSYFYIDCDGTRKYTANRASGKNIEIDLTNVQKCVFTYTLGYNKDYVVNGEATDILFV